jgi:hypothetical protein
MWQVCAQGAASRICSSGVAKYQRRGGSPASANAGAARSVGVVGDPNVRPSRPDRLRCGGSVLRGSAARNHGPSCWHGPGPVPSVSTATRSASTAGAEGE